MRTLALGDIHGAAKALEQVLDRANFDPASDELIFLGDIADGWSETKEAVDILLEVPNLIHLLGNHDLWFLQYILYAQQESLWLDQGGWATLESYAKANSRSRYDPGDIPLAHEDFFRKAQKYYVDAERNFAFVHGGFDPYLPLEEHSLHDLVWDRSLWRNAYTYTSYNKVFIGHTSVGASGPDKRGRIWNLDTGAGWEGVLTLMDVDTEEYWQSDNVRDLYPNEVGRR